MTFFNGNITSKELSQIPSFKILLNKNILYIKDFGANLKNLRTIKNLSQEQLAFDCNIPISQIGRIERGEVNTTISTLYTLSKVLNITPSELVKF